MANEPAYRALLSIARRSGLGRSARRDLRTTDRTILLHERAPDRFIWLHTRYRTSIYDPRMKHAVRVFEHEARIQEARSPSDDLKQHYYAWDGVSLQKCTHEQALELLRAWESVDASITFKLFGVDVTDVIIDRN